MKNTFPILMIVLLTGYSTALAKKVKVRDVQEVDFNETDINGKVRNPDGALLIQKGQTEFEHLHRLREKFDQKLTGSTDYLKGDYEPQ